MNRVVRGARGRLRRVRRALFRRLGGFGLIGGMGLGLQRISGDTASSYQPRVGLDDQGAERVRPTTARWEAIAPHLPMTGSALDVGCNNGFFTFKMAEHGLLSLGIDSSSRNIATARLLGLRNDPPHAAFARLHLTSQTAASLPTVDVVLCLSVFHHLVRYQGLEEATEVMRLLASKSQRLMVFETGQPDEVSKSWWQELAFMGDDPQAWVSEFLTGLGFARVRQLGSFPGHENPVERALVIAEKPAISSERGQRPA